MLMQLDGSSLTGSIQCERTFSRIDTHYTIGLAGGLSLQNGFECLNRRDCLPVRRQIVVSQALHLFQSLRLLT